MDDTEFKVPLTLLALGVVIIVGYAFVTAGGATAGIVLLGLAVQTLVGTLLGVAACYATAWLLSTGFGDLNSAFLKLAAVFTFPLAVSLLIPWVGWLVAIVMYFGLLAWLFDLEPFEILIFVIVLALVRLVAVAAAVAAAGAHVS